MQWDDLAEAEAQKLFAGWLMILTRESPALPLKLAGKHCPQRQPVEASSYTTGSYNMCSFVTFDDGSRVLVRFPILGRSRFRKEKTNDELMVMQYVSRRTPIPIPKILGAGLWALGPYMVTSVAEGTLLSKCIRGPSPESSRIDPNVPQEKLERAYRTMARVILELSKLPFPVIGPIDKNSGDWKMEKRPLTLKMNELVRVGNLPPNVFRQGPFETATEYFKDLADQHLLHFKYQRNNIVDNEQDCWKKYIARCLFKKIAGEIPTLEGPFRLYCDDFRPSNVLVDEETLEAKAVIDWEFTYAAPVEFTRVAPWWLLFESPESWESDLDQFLERYKPKLEIFLRIMRQLEDEQLQCGTLTESQRLARHMAKSMDTGLFWFCLAARKSFMFDEIYWKMIDEKYFGEFTTLEQRLGLLTEEDREAMEALVSEKMAQKEEARLDEHQSFDEIVEL